MYWIVLMKIPAGVVFIMSERKELETSYFVVLILKLMSVNDRTKTLRNESIHDSEQIIG